MGEIHSFLGKLAGGSSTRSSLVASTVITHCAAMEEKGASSLTKMKSWLMDSILRHQLFINFTDASGTVELALKLSMTGQSAGIVELWLSQTK